MSTFFNVNTIFFTVLGYQMSYVEFFGTIFTAYSVWLAAKNKVLTWPVSIIGGILYAFLFFQIQLYSDLVEQFYYLATAIWGWWVWVHPKTKKETDLQNQELAISTNSSKSNLVWLGMTVVGTMVLTIFMAHIDKLLPTLFPVPASYPFWDAFTTVMSLVATYFLVKRKFENWYLWITVDIIDIWLYGAKHVIFLSILYTAFLVTAIKGYLEWRKILKSYAKEN